jgi:hypothetical protein
MQLLRTHLGAGAEPNPWRRRSITYDTMSPIAANKIFTPSLVDSRECEKPSEEHSNQKTLKNTTEIS